MKTIRSVILVLIFGTFSAIGQSITGLSPTSGPVGTSVTISGSAFNASYSKMVVYLGGVRATVLNGGTTSLNILIPLGASSGFVTATDTSMGKTAYSPLPFTVTFSALRIIDTSFFAQSVNFALSANPGKMIVGDIDGDGKPDIVVSLPSSGTVAVVRNIGSPGSISSSSFDVPITFGTIGSTPYGLALGDLDGDGDLDIAVTDSSSDSVYVLTNASTPGSINLSVSGGISVGTKPYGVAIGDLNLDGQPDIATANKGSNNVSVRLNTSSAGTISFGTATSLSTGASSAPVAIVIGDVDNNGFYNNSILTANSGASTLSLYQGDGGAPPTFISSTLAIGATQSDIALTDFDGDGLLDIAVTNSLTSKISICRNASSFSPTPFFQSKVDFEAGTSPSSLLVGDVEGDGKPDLVVALRSVDSVVVLRNRISSVPISSNSFAAGVRFFDGNTAGPSTVVLADIDRDGKPDIVVANSSSGSFSILRNRAIRNEQEPNNDTSNANRISIGETVLGSISTSGDVDYYTFAANAGDTLEITASNVGNSTLLGRIELRDSSGGYLYVDNWYYQWDFPYPTAIHGFVAIPATKKYYLRFSYDYDYKSFPNSTGGVGKPQLIGGVAAQTASSDTGKYGIRIERASASAPDVGRYANVYQLFSDHATFEFPMAPNGLNTTGSLEYGLSQGTLTNETAATQNNPASGITLVDVSGSLTGLSPNTLYYYRSKAVNSAGTNYGDINSFQTPPAAVGWVNENSGVPNMIHGMSFPFGASTGYAVGDGAVILKTTDGGNSWQAQTTPPAGSFMSVSFLNNSLGLAVSRYSSQGQIVKTTNGGASWTDQTNPSYYYDLNAVRFFSGSVAIAAGDNGVIMRSTDSWNTWDTVRTGGPSLYNISVVSGTNAYVVGENGTILKTTDAGASWSTIASGTTNWLHGVYFSNDQTGFVVGGSAAIRKTTNGGATWTDIVPNIGPNYYQYSYLYNIAFKDANNGIIVGDGGIILRTIDGGKTWDNQRSGTYVTLEALAYIGRSATVGGEGGTILNYLDPATETEPNDDTGSANAVAFRDDVDGSIQPIGDVDYYALTLSAPDTIEVSVMSRDSVAVNGILELLNSVGTPIAGASNDDFIIGDTTQSRVVYVAAAGTYYARFSAKYGTTGNYRIRFRQGGLKPIVPFGGTASILTTTSATLAAPVVTNNDSTFVSFEYGLTASYGTSVPADSTPVVSQQLLLSTKTVAALSPFTEYHFRVKAQNSGGITYGPDVIFVTSLGTIRSEIEPNNVNSQATTIFIGDTVNAVISTSSDVDYYRFQAKAGDTLEVFASPTGSSASLLRVEVIDSTADNEFINNNYLPDPGNVHSAFIAVNTGIYFLRLTYAYNYNSYYPSKPANNGRPVLTVPRGGAAGVASNDTGSYQIRFRRFAPSMPDVRSDAWVQTMFSDFALIRGEVSANGLSTTVSVEYGTTTAYGNSIVAPGPVLHGVTPDILFVPVPGLQPNATYHYRVKATNALGTRYSADNSVTTPLPSDGWSRQQSGTLQSLQSIAMPTDSTVIVAGENGIVRSTDGGSSWTNPSNPGAYLYAVGFANKDTGVAAGWGFIRTTDGGATWNYLSIPFNGYVKAIRFVSPSRGLAAGAEYNSNRGTYEGTIGLTTDAGQSWSIIRTSSIYEFGSISALNRDTVFVAGANGTILRTFNFSAATPLWDSLYVGTSDWINDIAFNGPAIGTVVLDRWGIANQVLRTTNGGTSWTPISLPAYSNYRSVAYSGSGGVIAGTGGAIVRSSDGGATWSQQQSGTQNDLYAGAYRGRFAYVSGQSGTVLKHVDPLGEVEPNDASGTANPFAIGEQVEGSIAASGDVDFYSFNAATNDTLEVLLTSAGGNAVNGALQLMQTNGTTVLAQNDDFVPGDSSTARVVYVIGGNGTYYVRVAGSSLSSTGTYLLRLQRTNLAPRIASTTVLSLTPTSASITGTVDPNNLSTTVQVQWGATTAYDTAAAVNESPLLAGQQRMTVTKTLSGLTENTDYHFRLVASNGAGATNGFDGLFHTPRSAALPENEPNDSSVVAQQVSYGDSVNGKISSTADVDYYKIQVASGDTLEVFGSRRGTSNLDSRIELYDSSYGNSVYAGWDGLPSYSNPHYVFRASSATTLFLRYLYASNYSTSFPNQVNDVAGEVPRPIRHAQEEGILGIAGDPLRQGIPMAIATSDTGEYQLYVRRFAPGKSDVSSTGTTSSFSDAVSLYAYVRPNGSNTSVTFEYGPTTSYGSQAQALENPVSGINILYLTSPQITGLQANTTYHMRITATNTGGAQSSTDYSLVTPKSPEGWSRQTSGTNQRLWDVAFPSTQTGYVAGTGGIILKTTDGGSTWSSQTSGTTVTLRGVSFVSDQVGTVVGNGGNVFRTTNGGSNWISQLSGQSYTLFDVKMLNASEIVAVGNLGMIVRSTNSGASWDTVHTGTEAFRMLTFPAGNDTGYAAGYDANSGNGVLLRTPNRGASWQSVTGPGTSVALLSAWFFDGHTGVVGGPQRTMYRTTNGGTTWSSTAPVANGYYAYGLSFVDNNNGIATTDGGGILRTDDGGVTWKSQESGTYNPLFGAVISGRNLTTVGEYGTILGSVGLLASPTNLVASYTTGDSVLLTWADNSNAETGFSIERKTGSAGSFASVGSVGANATSSVTTVNHVARGRIYYYRVYTYSASDTSAYSSEDSASVPLGSPTALDAASASSSRINLTWQTATDAKDGFKIERALNRSGPFTQIDSVTSGVTTYANTGLSSGTVYFYRIRSYNSTFASGYSNVDSASTALGKALNVAVNPSGVTNGPITIQWAVPTGAANVWYNVDSPPAFSPPSTQIAVSNNSFVISSPPVGLRWIYFVLQDALGNTDLGAYDSVQTRFDAVPPQITDQTTLPTITITGSAVSDPASVSITAAISKPSGIAPLNAGVLEYKKSNSNTITPVTFPTTSGGTVILSSLNSLFLTIGKPNGAEYRIRVSDQAGNTASTSWKSFTVFVNNPPVSDFVAPAAGTSDDATTLVSFYRLFSVPYDLQDKKPGSFMETTDKGLGAHAKNGVNYYYWRMQRYVNGAYQDYEDFKTQDVLTAGTAFFLISREQKFVTVGAGNLVKASDMFNNGIQVTQGWNLVGNPFPDDFPADSLFVLAGTITGKAYYDGSGPDGGWWKTGANAQTLKKWEGLAINVTQSTSLRFKSIPQARRDTTRLVPAASAFQALAKDQSRGWLLRFDATRSGSAIRDVENTIGIAPGAKVGYDPFDSFQPPILAGRTLALYFKNADGAMSSDIRPASGNGETWEMKVLTGDRGSRVTLGVSHIVELPDPALKAYMLDLDDKMAYDLRERSEVEFGSKEGTRNFRVAVGTRQYVDSVSTSYGIDLVPRAFKVFQNYPNPFNPATVVRFAVPGVQPSYRVSLKIYNIIGQEVKTLLDGDIQPGYYEKTWNAQGFASGTYFYRLTVDGGTGDSRFSDVKKMVLIK